MSATSSLASRMIVAVAQPHVQAGSPEEAKVTEARELVRLAAAEKARIVAFPEGYPGPLRITSSFDAKEAMVSAAMETGCAVCWSRVERCADGRWRLVAYVHDRDGCEVMRYERGHPATGDVHPALSGAALAPGAEPSVFRIDGVPMGVVICSELWIPEVARLLAVEGAEVLFAPAGGGFREVAPNWQVIARARAVENECYLALTQHLFGDEVGSALIAGPEDLLCARTDAGVLVGSLDLQRVRWLRGHDDSMESPKPFRALPGLLRARRPELYSRLVGPQEGLYDYSAAERWR